MRIAFALPFLLLTYCVGSTYQDLLQKPDPYFGLVTARVVEQPSRANLDLVAWVENALFHTPGGRDSVKSNPIVASVWKTCPVVESSASSFTQTKSKAQPMSFMALKRNLGLDLGFNSWNVIYAELGKCSALLPQRAYIELGKTPALWIEMVGARQREFVKVKSQAWLDTTGKLDAWLIQYRTPLQNQEQVLDWATQTASYWYPSLNTDLVWDLPDSAWPGEQVEAAVRKFMGKIKVPSPTIVIRGNPLGTPHYTVIQIPGMKPVAQRSATRVGDAENSVQANKMADRQLPINYTRNMERIQTELQNHGGSFSAWDSSLTPWKTSIRRILDSVPVNQMGMDSKSGVLFFRRSLASMIAGDPEAQMGASAPLPALIAFKGKLEEAEVNMLFVPVPTKAELYADALVGNISLPKDGILNPWARKFVLDAQEEGLEIVDMLPPFIDARKLDRASTEPLYQKDDTHWTRRGMLLAAQILADRVKQYSWYSELKPQGSRFRVRDTAYTRLGDIVERLPANVQTNYPPVKLAGSRVFVQDSVPYQGPKGSPIILIGDSFTGVMESVDCKNGGVGAHLARLTGLDVEVITSWGGGPNVRAKFLKARTAQLAQARLVIYLMTARDLWDYPGGWDALESQ